MIRGGGRARERGGEAEFRMRMMLLGGGGRGKLFVRQTNPTHAFLQRQQHHYEHPGV